MNNVYDRLRALVEHYESTRGVGNTTAMIEGAHQHRVILITVNEAHGKAIRDERRLDCLPVNLYGDLSTLKGVRLPMLIDHAALTDLLRQSMFTIHRLEDNQVRLESDRDAWRLGYRVEAAKAIQRKAALDRAIEQFQWQAAEHQRKGESEQAEEYRGMVQMCREAIGADERRKKEITE